MTWQQITLEIPDGLAGTIWHYRNQGLRYPMHTHRELEFNLVLRGRGAYLLDDRKYEIARHTATWLFPKQPHILLEQSKDLEMLIVVWRPNLVRKIAPAVLRKTHPQAQFCKQIGQGISSRLGTLLKEIAGAIDDPQRFNHGLAYALRCAWTAYSQAKLTALGVEVHPAVERAARALGDTPGLSLDEVARIANLSQSRLSHLFRQEVGLTLAAYRNRRRIEHFLLLYGNGRQRTMLAAALDAGFGSYVQFHRIFTQTLGQSPRSWQSQRNANNSSDSLLVND